MNFNDVMAQGMAGAEAMWGDAFVLDGDETTYVGTFNSWRDSRQIGPGGFEIHIDGVLVASLRQFKTTPYNGQRITVNGKRYVIVEVDQDSAAWTFALKGANE